MLQNRSSERPVVGTPRRGNIPVASMVESIVGCKWSVQLLVLITDGSHRPSALLRSCPGLSAKVMNERLSKMIHFDILQRTVFGEKPPVEVEYRLTRFGLRFICILEEVRRLQSIVNQEVALEIDETHEAEKRST